MKAQADSIAQADVPLVPGAEDKPVVASERVHGVDRARMVFKGWEGGLDLRDDALDHVHGCRVVGPTPVGDCVPFRNVQRDVVIPDAGFHGGWSWSSGGQERGVVHLK